MGSAISFILSATSDSKVSVDFIRPLESFSEIFIDLKKGKAVPIPIPASPILRANPSRLLSNSAVDIPDCSAAKRYVCKAVVVIPKRSAVFPIASAAVNDCFDKRISAPIPTATPTPASAPFSVETDRLNPPTDLLTDLKAAPVLSCAVILILVLGILFHSFVFDLKIRRPAFHFQRR